MLFTDHSFNLKKPLVITTHQRLFLWITLLSLALLGACSSFRVNANNFSITPENQASQFMRIKLLNSFVLKEKAKDNLPITEISDLAWDKDEAILYAVSDEGLLYHLTPIYKNKALVNFKVIYATRLKDKNKKPLKNKKSDSEGLSIINANNGKKGDSTLIISFEVKPRIALFSPTGVFIKNIKTKKKLRQRKYFRHQNSALESVVLHPKYGILTASERPLRADPISRQTVYSSKGKEWHFKASKVKNSSITALEVLKNGDVLILERAYNGLLSPVVISLRQLKLAQCDSHHFCKTSLIAKFDSSKGWRLDNFEGLTRFKENQYLMVSDDNGNPLQNTIFVLFTVLNK